MGNWAPALSVMGTAALGNRWALRLGGSWLPSRSNDYEPGQAQISLAFARVAACWVPFEGRPRWAVESAPNLMSALLADAGSITISRINR